MNQHTYITPMSLLMELRTGGSLLNTASNEGYEVIEVNPFGTPRMKNYDPFFEDFGDED